jgi:cysteine desulfurase/selenocysteine lyase
VKEGAPAEGALYLDNAATSWPKPPGVARAMARFLDEVGASPGRSGHRLAVEAERIRLDAREAVASILGVRDPLRVIFAAGATEAINLALLGLLPPGSHVVASALEHNAVLRPIRALEARGVTATLAPCRPDGSLDPSSVEEALRPATRLIALVHASNVCGTVLPVRAVGELARARGIPLLVDAAQTAGSWPIDLEGDRIDLLAFAGHKGLLGPAGIGGLAIGERFDVSRLPPLLHGGTGSRSEHEVQPEALPDRFEAGTPNMPGIAGLGAGARYVLDRGIEAIRSRERSMTARLIDGLRSIPGIAVIGTGDPARQTAAVSFTIAGRSPSDVAGELDERHGILCRPGLQCAPRAHRTLGTFPGGTVRLSPGPFTSDAEIDRALDAVAAVAGAARRG